MVFVVYRAINDSPSFLKFPTALGGELPVAGDCFRPTAAIQLLALFIILLPSPFLGVTPFANRLLLGAISGFSKIRYRRSDHEQRIDNGSGSPPSTFWISEESMYGIR